MNKWFKDEKERKRVFTYTLTGILLIVFYHLLGNLDLIRNFFSGLFKVLAPFIWGSIFAFLMMPVSKKIEELIGDRLQPKTKRTISSILSVLFLMCFIGLLIGILVPQLTASISSLSTTISNFLRNTDDFETFLSQTLHLSKELIDAIERYSREILTSVMNTLNTAVPKVISIFSTTISAIANFFLGFIVAIYILVDREKLLRDFRHFFAAVLSGEGYERGSTLLFVSFEKFSRFFSGKLIDSFIIGVLCLLAMLILKLDYPVLIAVVIGVTNIIPFFGPFIGAVPSALILLIVDPKQALIFVVMILILQQLDGNIIGPRILGDSVGLSSLWIMFAILVGGSYFGFFGMLFGVPVFAILHDILVFWVESRLSERNNNLIKKDDR